MQCTCGLERNHRDNEQDGIRYDEARDERVFMDAVNTDAGDTRMMNTMGRGNWEPTSWLSSGRFLGRRKATEGVSFTRTQILM